MSRLGLLIAFALAVGALSSQTLYVHSIKSIRQVSGDQGYTLDGAKMSNSARLKLLAPANFGPTGVYKKKISIVDGYQSSGDLTQVFFIPKESIFFFGNFNQLDPSCQLFTQEEIDSLYSWSKAGGKLIVAAGQKMGGLNSTMLNSLWGFDWQYKKPSNFIPTSQGNQSIIFKGPFGTVTTPQQANSVQGYYSKVPVNSVVLAREQSGNPTLVMDCNTLDLWIADIDAFTVADLNIGGPSVSAGSGISNMQDKFWANTIAFMDQLQQPPVITGGSGAMAVPPLYNSYQWYRNNTPLPGAGGVSFNTEEAGDYFVETTVNGGCRVRSNIIRIGAPEPVDTTSEVTPTVQPNECEVFVPSAFSPDEDGLNEELCFYGPCVTEFELKVYSRWGELVFETREREQCWNGRFNGRALDPAVFAWTLSATFLNGDKVVKRGNVTLIR